MIFVRGKAYECSNCNISLGLYSYGLGNSLAIESICNVTFLVQLHQSSTITNTSIDDSLCSNNIIKNTIELFDTHYKKSNVSLNVQEHKIWHFTAFPPPLR